MPRKSNTSKKPTKSQMRRNNEIKKASSLSYYPCVFERKELDEEHIKTLSDFDKSKHVFVCERFNTNNVDMIELDNHKIGLYIDRKGAINEILTPFYNQRLVFDLDFKDEDYTDGKTPDIEGVLNLLKSLAKSLKCKYRIAGYGKFPQDEVDKLINDNKYKFFYEEKHNTEKYLSLHALFNVVATAETYKNILHGTECYLTDGNIKIEYDGSIYQDVPHLLRLVYSNKVDSNGIQYKAIDMDIWDYKKWFVCVDEDISEPEKIEELKKWIIIEKAAEKPKQQDKNKDGKKRNCREST